MGHGSGTELAKHALAEAIDVASGYAEALGDHVPGFAFAAPMQNRYFPVVERLARLGAFMAQEPFSVASFIDVQEENPFGSYIRDLHGRFVVQISDEVKLPAVPPAP